MKDSISERSAASEPYSSGCAGNSTTWCASRLLRAEYGTRRSDGEIGTESAKCHSPSLSSTNEVRPVLGSSTISTSVPSSSTAETVAMRRSFLISSALFGPGFVICREPLQHVQRLAKAQSFDPLQERDHVAVGPTAEAMKIALPRIDRERGIMVVVERTETHERATRWFQFNIVADHRFERDFTFDLFDPLAQHGVNMA